MDKSLALHAAIAAYDIENFDRLLDHPDVDIDYKNAEGKTPLVASINKDFGSDMALSLISADCDINCEAPNNSTPLHQAIMEDLIDVTHELIRRGAYINAKDGYNDTPLCTAITTGNLETFCLLLYYEADVNMLAGLDVHATHLILAVYLNQYDIFKVMLDYCDDISFENGAYDTAFSTAIREINPMAVDLLKKGARVTFIGFYGNVCLYRATLYEDSELFKLILPKYEYATMPKPYEPFLYQYLTYCKFSRSEWLECFYLILNNPVASDFVRDCENFIQTGDLLSILWNIMSELACRDIELKDRISILYICLSAGAEIKAHDLQTMQLLFGSNDEFEAVVYAGELSYNDYKKQMRLLFQEPFNSTVSVDLYNKFSNPEYENVPDIPLCSLGFFSVSSEKRIEYLDWIDKDMPINRKVIAEVLNKIPQFPSLLELSRDQAQKFIEEKFKILKAYQFYDVVKGLKLPQNVKNIILFKQPIY